MSGRQQARKQQTHSAEVRQVYERVLAYRQAVAGCRLLPIHAQTPKP
jgi:hypothetical protein